MNDIPFDQPILTKGLMALGACYQWGSYLLALHIVSDAVMALAFLSVPFTLLYILRNRKNRQFDRVLLCCAILAAACGSTHIIEILSIWNPIYWVSGGVKAFTALASMAAAILLIISVPSTLARPGLSTLQRVDREMNNEIGGALSEETTLQKGSRTLEYRQAQRIAQLEAANRSLLQENERFAMAADAAGMAFWSFDIASNTLQWDERMFHLYGVAQVDGDQPYEIWASSLHIDDRERCERELAEALNGTRVFDTEFRITPPNGGERYLRAAARITRDLEGRAVHMFGVNIDITELRHAEEQFRLAIEAAPTGMLLMNRTGAIVMVNAQIETLLGYPRSELLGQQIEMLVPERFRVHHPEFRKGFFRTPRGRAMGAGRDLYCLRKDGSEVPVEIGLNPLHTSQGMFVLSSIVDLSQRRAMERLRTDFVSTVSHELRTPLTSISGSLGLLQSGAVGTLPDKAAEMVEIAHKNSTRLVRIINDILDIGRLEAGRLELKMVEVSLGPLLRQVIQANFSYAEKYGVHFVLNNEPSDDIVLGDFDRITQVITNLLSNAAKFSPFGADVVIRVIPKPSVIRVEVEDFGTGIPEAFQSRIFEKFAQADASAARRVEGTGLGLSIARKLVEAMGGNIGYSTLIGKGTVFYIELRRADGAAVATVMRSARPRILYLDFEDDFINAIEDCLEGRAEVVRAHGLHEAERRLRGERFDLIILNQSPTWEIEIDVIAKISAQSGERAPVVLLAAEEPRGVQQKVADVIIKSQVSKEQIARTILAHLPALQT
jgi:PAS domain S-box-containing protein